MAHRIYLDHAATSPLRPEAKAAMEEGFRLWANPSSPHAEGRKARALLEDARERIKTALGWDGELIFTSGASEAAALALGRSKLPLTNMSTIEHDSVGRFAGDLLKWQMQEGGGGLGSTLEEAFSGLVAVQHVNSELGIIHDSSRIRKLTNDGGGWWLCDCAQTAGKIPLPDADMIIISAHKFGGPIGVGALLVRDFNMLEPEGGQERGYRRGTENLPGALGMAAALECDQSWMDEAARLRHQIDAVIEQGGGSIVAGTAPRIPTIASYRMPGVSAASQLIRFDAAGIALSAGSACASGTLKPSDVLHQIWYKHPDEVIRVSFGWNTTEDEVERFGNVWLEMARASP